MKEGLFEDKKDVESLDVTPNAPKPGFMNEEMGLESTVVPEKAPSPEAGFIYDDGGLGRSTFSRTGLAVGDSPIVGDPGGDPAVSFRDPPNADHVSRALGVDEEFKAPEGLFEAESVVALSVTFAPKEPKPVNLLEMLVVCAENREGFEDAVGDENPPPDRALANTGVEVAAPKF